VLAKLQVTSQVLNTHKTMADSLGFVGILNTGKSSGEKPGIEHLQNPG